MYLIILTNPSFIMKKLYILLFTVLITILSFGQTPTLKVSGDDAPPNGSTVYDDPETPNNADIDFETTNFVMCADANGTTPSGCQGYIKWFVENTNGNVYVDGGNIFTSNDGFTYSVTGLTTGQTYFLRAELVNTNGNPLSTPVVYSLTVNIASYIDVANLAALRSSVIDDPNRYYRVTGEVVNTYDFNPFSEHTMFFQDGTAGIKVYDQEYEVTSYSIGDAVSNIRGRLFNFVGNELVFVPTYADWGPPNSTGNTPAVSTVTIANLIANIENYKSELVNINGVTFADGNGTNTFSYLMDYSISDGTPTIFRTIFDNADYVTGAFQIPQGNQNVVGIVSIDNSTVYVTSRSSSDITSSPLSTDAFEIDSVRMYPNPSSLGYVNLSSKSNSNLIVSVFDILGKQIFKETVTNNILNVSKLNAGMYIMKLSQDDATGTKKLIIK